MSDDDILKWQFRGGPDIKFATVCEERREPSPNLSDISVIAELRPVGSVQDVVRRGQLIAAAPDLYAALEDVLKWIDHPDSIKRLTWKSVAEQIERKCRAALRKARGEQ